MDRVDESWAYSEVERMAQGQIKYGESEIGFPRIIHYSYTSASSSNFNSLVDIALGSTRLCCENAFLTTPRSQEVTQKVWPKIYESLVKHPRENSALGVGLKFQPEEVKSAAYRADYEKLQRYLAHYSKDLVKPPTQ